MPPRLPDRAVADTRVIIHIDLDCFYAQVEQKRLNIPRDVPVAVQQWQGLIAVNYAARAQGITRHMRVAEAKQKCPEIVLVHVETIGDTTQGTEENVSRLTQKACLERYRRANADIMHLLHTLIPTSTIEKASIDEVYIDATALVDAELYETSTEDGDGIETGKRNFDTTAAFAWGSIVLGNETISNDNEFDVRLATGAGIACRLRGAILEKLGFTSSAGIATNKLLAKIGSAMHKPNQQTVILSRAVAGVMRDLPLSKLRNFGGKLGSQLETMGCTTAGQVNTMGHEALAKVFGAEKAASIIDAVNGCCNAPVEEKEKPKSMLAAKSFEATNDLGVLQRWMGILAAELVPRMAADEAAFRRRPRTLAVHFRGGSLVHSSNTEGRSRQAPMPRMPSTGPCVDTLTQAGWEIFKARCLAEGLPCSRLALSAGDFVDLPPINNKSAITRFLVSKEEKVAKKLKVDSVDSNDQGGGGGGGSNDTIKTNIQQSKHEETKEDDDAETAALLADVDVQEQRRILKEAALLKAFGAGKGASTKMTAGKRDKSISSTVKTNTKSKKLPPQPGIARFFQKNSDR